MLTFQIHSHGPEWGCGERIFLKSSFACILFFLSQGANKDLESCVPPGFTMWVGVCRLMPAQSSSHGLENCLVAVTDTG